MLKHLFNLLNIKPNEAGLVKHLFLIQFLLGVATSFLYTSSLTLFLSSFSIKILPWVFILSAVLILAFNRAYAYFERKYSALLLLKTVVFFSILSTIVFWFMIKLFNKPWLILLLAAWNSLIYMLVGYAFWGLSALLFNVRESKRVFSIVGAGDIPAKMLGYLSVSVLVNLTGVINLLWISVFGLAFCLLVMKRMHVEINQSHGHIYKVQDAVVIKEKMSISRTVYRLFHSKLIFLISMVSLLAFIIFSFVDFTFLSDIKVKYKHEHDLASFIAIFFAGGRMLAIVIKVLLSSRMISKIGLLNSLLITPVLLLIINGIVIFSNGSLNTELYLLGSMVLVIEILRSIVQEPVFFILFQPLSPHDRLKGHLIAKGYTLPIALLSVGTFLVFYLKSYNDISINYLARVLTIFLFIWVLLVFLIKKEYMETLIHSLKRGYFTGAELFLNNSEVSSILTNRLKSKNPRDVINGLNLLERSCHPDIAKLLLHELNSNDSQEVKEYVIQRIINNRMHSALPSIKKLINHSGMYLPFLYKAWFFLENKKKDEWKSVLQGLDIRCKKEALTGMIMKNDHEINELINDELEILLKSNDINNLILANDVIKESVGANFRWALESLLHHPLPFVYEKAMETAGKVKDFSLFEDVYSLAIHKHAIFAFQRAIINYGDEIFNNEYWAEKETSEAVINALLKAASKVKGPKSDDYLLSIFSGNNERCEHIISALWNKSANIKDHKQVIEKWLEQNLESIRLKISCFLDIHNNIPANLLEEALLSEMQQDLESILKACALIYDREQIDRFIEVYKLDNQTRVANALELLELTIPKKYFAQISRCVELRHDLLKKQEVHHSRISRRIDRVIDEVVNDHRAGFNSWSRSVALYIAPKLLNKETALAIAGKTQKEGDLLIRETTNYVLSILK